MTQNKLALIGLGVAALLVAALYGIRQPATPIPPPPDWAYPVGAPAKPPATASVKPPAAAMMHVPDSNQAYTRAQVNDRFGVPDWHPEDHPAMPDVVAHGHKPDVAACGYCHLPTGQGRPENAGLAGQPKAYIIQQVLEMRAGRRHSSQPKMGPPKSMVGIAQHVADGELESAAAYFSALPYKPWIKVVETASVPKAFANSHGMMELAAGGTREAIGTRIIETALDEDRTELRDTASGFIAYVPPGSIARGEALVRSGVGGQPCRACHGPALKGMGGTPAIAGRSPSYVVRQLFDIKYGARSGPAVQPMQAEVAHMSDANRVDIAAYLASLNP